MLVPLDPPIGIEEYARCQIRDAAMTEAAIQSEGRARREHLAPGIVRIASAGAIMANVSFPIIEFWRLISAGDVANVRYAAFATALTMALHSRHVVLGLRNERLHAARWTLAALAIVNVAAAILVGRSWALQLASLMVSILIVLRPPLAIVVAGAVVFTPGLLLQMKMPLWQDPVSPMLDLPATHIVLAIIWRSATLYVPVRLVSTIRQLEAARRELESRAVLRTRRRIEADLQESLGLALERIVSEGEAAESAARRDARAASHLVRRLVTDSRRALAEARRIVAGYQSVSLRSELDAAIALLEAAGATVRVIGATGASPGVAPQQSRDAIRAAVIRALQEESAGCTVQVALDGADHAQLTVTFDRPGEAKAAL